MKPETQKNTRPSATPHVTVTDDVEKPRRRSRPRMSQSEALWYEVTKVLVPLWFGFDEARKAMGKAEDFPPHAALCLVGLAAGSNCAVGLEMALRPSGFDREEARDVAFRGLSTLVRTKLVKQTPRQAKQADWRLREFQLTAKGKRIIELLKSSSLYGLEHGKNWYILHQAATTDSPRAH